MNRRLYQKPSSSKSGRKPTFANTSALLETFRDLDRTILELPSQDDDFYRDQVRRIEAALSIPDHGGWYSKLSVDQIVDHFMTHHYSDNGNRSPPPSPQHYPSQPIDEAVDEAMHEKSRQHQGREQQAPELGFKDHASGDQGEKPSSLPPPSEQPQKQKLEEKPERHPQYGFPIFNRNGKDIVTTNDVFRALRALDRSRTWPTRTNGDYQHYLTRVVGGDQTRDALLREEIDLEVATSFFSAYLRFRQEDITQQREDDARETRATMARLLLKRIMKKRNAGISLDDSERIVSGAEAVSIQRPVYRVVLSVDPSDYVVKELVIPAIRGEPISLRFYYTRGTVEPMSSVSQAVAHALPEKDASRTFISHLDDLVREGYLSIPASMFGTHPPEQVLSFFERLRHSSQSGLVEEIASYLREAATSKPSLRPGSKQVHQKRPLSPIGQFKADHHGARIVSYPDIMAAMLAIDIRDGRSASTAQYYERVIEDARRGSILDDDRLIVYAGKTVDIDGAVRFLEQYQLKKLMKGQKTSS